MKYVGIHKVVLWGKEHAWLIQETGVLILHFEHKLLLYGAQFITNQMMKIYVWGEYNKYNMILIWDIVKLFHSVILSP